MDDVRIRLKAADLPDHLRGTIDPAHEVEVSVRDLGASAGADAIRLMREHRAVIAADPSRAEPDPVGRIRALRDEWD